MLSYFVKHLLVQTKCNVVTSKFKNTHRIRREFIQTYYVFTSLNGINILLKKLYEELPLGIVLCASYHAFTE
jgi:hypothetical protein